MSGKDTTQLAGDVTHMNTEFLGLVSVEYDVAKSLEYIYPCYHVTKTECFVMKREHHHWLFLPNEEKITSHGNGTFFVFSKKNYQIGDSIAVETKDKTVLFKIIGDPITHENYKKSEKAFLCKKLIDELKVLVPTELEIDSINSLINGVKGDFWRKAEKEPRYLYIKHLTEKYGKGGIKDFLFADDVSTKEIYAKCVFLIHIRNDKDLHILNKQEYGSFIKILYVQLRILPNKYQDLRGLVQLILTDEIPRKELEKL